MTGIDDSQTGHDGLAFDPDTAVGVLSDADPALGKLIARVGGYRPSMHDTPDVFHTLMRAIVYQQLSGKAAATIHARVLAALGGGQAPGAAIIQASDPEMLRAAGLSANKQASLRALAAAQLDDTLPDESQMHRYTDQELIDCYSAIKGIGRWTVEMLLMFHLGRPDVMPIHDLGVRKGYALVYGLDALPKPKALEAATDVWRPYRSVGAWFMWRALELDAGSAAQPR